MRFLIKFTPSVTALLFCLIVTSTHAQQAGTSPTPAPQSTSGATTPSNPGPLNIKVKASERAIDASIPNDPAVDTLVAPYSAKVNELSSPIGKLVGDLTKGGVGAGSLGNFVADALRDRAQVKLGKPVLLAITNSGGLRKNDIPAGDLSASDIYELLPFDNALVSLDLTGEQLRRFLDVVVSHRDAQSGARITYRTNDKKQNEVVSVKLGAVGAEQEIVPQATYTIVTIDYLVDRGGDYLILKEAKNITPLKMTMRDAVLDYVKAETAAGRPIKATLDGRFRFDKPAVPKTEGEPK